MTSFGAMTWNVENLFRPEPQAQEVERERYQQKLGLLADVIGRLDPDVVGLQEVGGEDELGDLQGALDGGYPHRAASTFQDGRGIRVAFLSKHSVKEREHIVEFPEGPALDVHDLSADGGSEPIDRMGRGALRLRVTKDGLTVDLIACHLKSKLLSFPRSGGKTSFVPRDEGERAQVAGIALMRRMAEAVTLRIRANGLLGSDESVPLLVLGDLNDVPEAQTSLIFTGPPGSEIGTPGFGQPDRGDDVRLFNLAPCIPLERRYSRIERGRPELIDQILVSVELFPTGDDGERRLPEADSHVDFRDRLPSVGDRLPSVGDDPGERAGDLAPDHAPVTARFEL
jgi:endonuclease/exonuclease/phosphatase family metal-dependent hydrolase